MEHVIAWLLAFVLAPAVGYTIARAQSQKAYREAEKKILEQLAANPQKIVEELITTFQQKGKSLQTTIENGDVLVRLDGKPWVNVTQYLRDQL